MALGMNRQKSTYDIGQFRTWIQFRRRVLSVDEDGFETVTTENTLKTKCLWVDTRGAYENRYSSVTEKHNQKYVDSGCTVVLRYSTRIAVTDECVKDGVVYEVKGINDFREGHHFMKVELEAKERSE